MTSTTSLEFELDNDRLVGGDTLQGQLRAASDRIASVQLRGRWRRQLGPTDATTGVEFEETLSRNAGERFAFEVEVPQGPFSFQDETATLEWELEAVGLDENGQEVGSATQPITVTAGDARERSLSREVPEDEQDTVGNSWIAGLLENLSSAFGHPTSREELFERLEYIDTGTGPYERETSLMGNLASILILLGFGIAGIVMAGSMFKNAHPAVPWVVRAIGLALAGWGGWILYKGIRNRMAEAALGDVVANAHPDMLVRGDTLTSTLSFAPDREVELNHVTAELKCIKVEKTKGSRHRHHHHHHDDDDGHRMRTHTYRDTLHSEKIELCGAQKLSIDEGCRFAEQFTVPETSKHSYYHSAPFWVRWLPLRGLTLSREIKWVVELHVDIEDWPDWVTRYQCVVYP